MRIVKWLVIVALFLMAIVLLHGSNEEQPNDLVQKTERIAIEQPAPANWAPLHNFVHEPMQYTLRPFKLKLDELPTPPPLDAAPDVVDAALAEFLMTMIANHDASIVYNDLQQALKDGTTQFQAPPDAYGGVFAFWGKQPCIANPSQLCWTFLAHPNAMLMAQQYGINIVAEAIFHETIHWKFVQQVYDPARPAFQQMRQHTPGEHPQWCADFFAVEHHGWWHTCDYLARTQRPFEDRTMCDVYADPAKFRAAFREWFIQNYQSEAQQCGPYWQ